MRYLFPTTLTSNDSTENQAHLRLQGVYATATMTQPGKPPACSSYEAAKKRAEPYNKVVGELLDMRKGAVVLVKDAIGHNRRAYVLVNNRLEGNAPLTV